MKITKYYLSLILISLLFQNFQAQDVNPKKAFILDRVVAVVGDFHVLQSDIEQQFLQLQMSQSYVNDEVKCEILDYFIEQKLLMSQAKIDSIEVSPGQVELSMEQRLQMFVNQFGSIEEMESYFNKSIYDIREDLRKTMREMMITNQVQQSIVGDLKITPSEVRKFYYSLNKDSIPVIDSDVKIAEIVVNPTQDEDAVFEVRERLLDLRKRIMEGESMSTLAILYSDDPSATSNFGEIGFRGKNELDPAYVQAAWSLKEGQVSKIVESSFGFHIIQVIERRGDRVNTRHILLKPKIGAAAKAQALAKLDSIRNEIMYDSLSFRTAAMMHSESEKTRANGGLVVNPANQASTFKLDELETKDYRTIRDLEVGEISQPYETTDEKGKLAYKIVKLISRTEPHRANLKQDYLLLQNMALEEKQNNAMQKWYKQKKQTTFIKIDESFKHCSNNKNELTSNK